MDTINICNWTLCFTIQEVILILKFIKSILKSLVILPI